MKKSFLSLLLLIIAVSGFSQFTLTGEFRPKFELRDGYKTLLTDDQQPAFITAQRSRLNFNYTDDRFNTRFSVQDVRIWGESPSKTDASSINVFEAWAEVFLNKSISIKFGRQELSFDQNRLLGASNWNDVGASHDLILFKYQSNINIQAGFAYNNDKTKNFESNYPVSFYKTLTFLRAEKDLGKYLNASLIFMADGNQKEASDDTLYQRLTYGGNLLFRNDSVKTRIYGTFYLQSGKSPTGTAINAYFLSLGLDHSFTKKLSGILAVDYFSGDNSFSPGTTKRSFNNLYGNTHNLYGYMDYFTQIDKDTKGGGLMDLYARLTSKISKKTSAELTYHYFSLTNDIIDSVSIPGQQLKADHYLGSEIDLVLKYKPAANLEVNVGYSTMLATSTMEILKGGSKSKFQHWAWVMLTFKPEFIKTNKNN